MSMPQDSGPVSFTTWLSVRKDCSEAFVNLQARWYGEIAAFSGFSNFEILSSASGKEHSWVFIQRFKDQKSLDLWRNSPQYKSLKEEAQSLTDLGGLKESESHFYTPQGGVTEIFITQVQPSQLTAFQEWMSKLHRAESKFPGFQKVYVQAPQSDTTESWVTLLQFDSQENLDRWLISSEREEILKQGKSVIKSLENHRVIPSFSGWFQSVTQRSEAPQVWKQTMLVLLVLFPVVMLQIKFLTPFTKALNPSLGTFIGNVISVSLISWPLMPIALYFLGWWFLSKPERPLSLEITGFLVVLLLYVIEITFFWHLL